MTAIYVPKAKSSATRDGIIPIPQGMQPRLDSQYRSLKLACQACPSKAKCGPNTARRRIRREKYEIVRDFARQCTASEFNPTALRRRKKVEMLFAHLKRILGVGRLRLRGPCGVQDAFPLAATAQNLRKLAKLKPMIPAIG